MILVLCAMKEEAADISVNIRNRERISYYNMPFYEGELHGKKVVVGMTGVGKVMSAMVVQKLIDTYKPEAVIFSGIAGAVNPDLEIGDVVVSKDCMQHDLDASTLGFKIGEIPYNGIRTIEAEKMLQQLQEEGTDNFYIESVFLCFSLFINYFSFVLVRVISDRADGNAPKNFKSFLNKSSVRITEIVNHILEKL